MGQRHARTVAVALALAAAAPHALSAAADSPQAEDAGARIAEARRLIDLAQRTERRYRELGPFRVRFEQAYDSVTFAMEEEQSGVIHVVPPGRMLWEYDEPEGQVAVLDGDTWWLVDPAIEQVLRRDRVPGEHDPLVDILAGRLDLLAVFALRASSEPPGEEGQAVVELVPREPRDDMELAVAWLDAGTGDMRRVDVIDPLGNRMSYRFGPPVVEEPPPGSAFTVTVPSGWTLVRE